VKAHGSGRSAGERNTYPRSTRLLRSVEFERVYREGRRRSSKQFVVFAKATAAGSAGSRASRFGWSVKRALGGAVVRNRIRRRVREIVRLHRSELPAGWDVVIHPRATVADAEFAALQKELVDLIRSALRP
jgi:ribonuclease P protein component